MGMNNGKRIGPEGEQALHLKWDTTLPMCFPALS
jgi:hypothetical protein